MQDRKPEVSVVIPTYNRAHLISRAIQSVLDQTYQDFEIIVVDDGSIDNTEEIIKSFKDDRVIYIRHRENKGPSAARNTGIKASKGEYIAFQDSDDEWFTEKLEKQIEVFDNCSPEVGVVYSGFFRIESGKKIYIPKSKVIQKEGNIHEELLKGNFIGTPSVLIKKKCFEKAKFFDENMPALEDWDLWIEISKHYTFKYINIPLLDSYSTPNGVNTNQVSLAKALEILIINYLEDFKKNKKNLSKYYLIIGHLLCLNGDLNNGRNYLIKAAKTNHLNIKPEILIFISFLGKIVYCKVIEFASKIKCKL